MKKQVQGYSEVAHNITYIKIQEDLNEFIESEPLKFKVSMVCLVMGCVC